MTNSDQKARNYSRWDVIKWKINVVGHNMGLKYLKVDFKSTYRRKAGLSFGWALKGDVVQEVW